MIINVIETKRTSAARPMQQPESERTIPSLLLTDVFATHATHFYVSENRTSSEPGTAVFSSDAAYASMIYDIRRLTGLTWEELAALFNVNRRSVHYWANAGALKPHNAHHLKAVFETVRQFDRRGASAARLALLTPNAAGNRPLDLLASGRYREAIAVFNSMPRLNTQPPPHPIKILPRPAELMSGVSDRSDPGAATFIPGRGRRLPKRRS